MSQNNKRQITCYEPTLPKAVRQKHENVFFNVLPLATKHMDTKFDSEIYLYLFRRMRATRIKV